MTDLSYSDLPVSGDTNNASDVTTPLNEIKSYVNGAGWVDASRLASDAVTTAKIADGTIVNGDISGTAEIAASKLASADLAKMGIDGASTVRRGKSIVATSENFTQTSFGYATTPDRVQNIVLPTDGLIFVVFDAAWQSSASGAGSAGIFVGSTIAKGVSGGSYPVTGGATSVGTGVNHLTSAPSTSGLVSASGGYTPLGSDPQVIAENTSGSAAVIMAAAGTYDVGIKYKSTSGSVTVSDRKLWVWTVGF